MLKTKESKICDRIFNKFDELYSPLLSDKNASHNIWWHNNIKNPPAYKLIRDQWEEWCKDKDVNIIKLVIDDLRKTVLTADKSKRPTLYYRYPPVCAQFDELYRERIPKVVVPVEVKTLSRVSIWDKCMHKLKDEFPEDFDVWIRPLHACVDNKNMIVLLAPNSFVLDTVMSKFLKRIKEVVIETASKSDNEEEREFKFVNLMKGSTSERYNYEV